MPGLYAWKQTPTKYALDIVRSILDTTGKPLSTKEIYNLAVQHEVKHPLSFAPARLPATPQSTSLQGTHGQTRKLPPPPPLPDNAIRSVRYLKDIILPHMAKAKHIEKFHSLRTLSQDEIRQRLANMSKAARKAKGESMATTTDVWLWRILDEKQALPKHEVKPVVFGEEVGVGEDWSHLNKRRQRARDEKIARDVAWLREVEAVRAEAHKMQRASGESVH